MRYACQIWGQSHSKTFDMIRSAQSKALETLNFKQSMEPSEPLVTNWSLCPRGHWDLGCVSNWLVSFNNIVTISRIGL